MNSKLKVIGILTLLAVSLLVPVNAECNCHNVGITTTVEPVRLHEGLKNAPQDLTFHVMIYNSGNYVEEGISLKIVEQRTGKTLYYNPEQVFLLPEYGDVKFDIIVPVDQLSGYDCGLISNNGWETETYIVSAYQKAFIYDCWGFDNWENVYVKVKPDCTKT